MADGDSPLCAGVPAPMRFYFVHSYFVELSDKEGVSLEACYGREFVAGFQRRNVCGVQFHPEKSHLYGKQLLINFGGLQGAD